MTKVINDRCYLFITRDETYVKVGHKISWTEWTLADVIIDLATCEVLKNRHGATGMPDFHGIAVQDAPAQLEKMLREKAPWNF